MLAYKHIILLTVGLLLFPMYQALGQETFAISKDIEGMRVYAWHSPTKVKVSLSWYIDSKKKGGEQ